MPGDSVCLAPTGLPQRSIHGQCMPGTYRTVLPCGACKNRIASLVTSVLSFHGRLDDVSFFFRSLAQFVRVFQVFQIL